MFPISCTNTLASTAPEGDLGKGIRMMYICNAERGEESFTFYIILYSYILSSHTTADTTTRSSVLYYAAFFFFFFISFFFCFFFFFFYLNIITVCSSLLRYPYGWAPGNSTSKRNNTSLRSLFLAKVISVATHIYTISCRRRWLGLASPV